ncbi:hypothetical protein FACS1894192_02820 [Bacilli bacterium]|nr:hypothetical protein FACS1894192_02820 [Bacilli bacterium]
MEKIRQITKWQVVTIFVVILTAVLVHGHDKKMMNNGELALKKQDGSISMVKYLINYTKNAISRVPSQILETEKEIKENEKILSGEVEIPDFYTGYRSNELVGGYDLYSGEYQVGNGDIKPGVYTLYYHGKVGDVYETNDTGEKISFLTRDRELIEEFVLKKSFSNRITFKEGQLVKVSIGNSEAYFSLKEVE